MKQLRVAVVGLGEFGRRYVGVLNALLGVTLAWGVDRNDDNRAQVEGVAERVTADLGDALADEQLDAVFVVTPEAAHRDIAVAALEAGKHVVVEKPLAMDEADGRDMLAAAEKSGRLLLPALLLRFDYRYAQLAQRLDSIGTVRSLYAYRNFDRRLFGLYSRSHSLIENSIHDIDLLLWYVGEPVVAAHGFCRTTLGLENPDVNWGVLEFVGGAIGVVQTTWLYPPQAHEDLQWNAGIHVMGDRGVLEVSNDARGFMAHTEDAGILLLDQTGWADIHGEPRGAFGAMLRHIAAVLRGETAYAGTTAAEAMEGIRIAQQLVADAQRRGDVPPSPAAS